MNVYVVDASVAVKWFLPENYQRAARRLRHAEESMHAPDFLTMEFANVLCKKVQRGDLGRSHAEAMLNVFHAVPVQLHPWHSHFEFAYQIAQQTRRSLYDCLYLALAVQLDGEMVTADRTFYNALREDELAGYLRWVEDVPGE